MCFQNSHTACSQDKCCQICYERSFASVDKAKYWSDKNKFKPWQLKKHSIKKIWFKCEKSGHEFESALSKISDGRWCPYPCCGNQKLCKDEDCDICFNASFASSDKAQYWSDKNKVTPREICKSSNKKYWFDCEKSGHEFESTLNNISSGKWCPYPCCANPSRILCLDENCDICFQASFASSDKAQYWLDKNDIQHVKNDGEYLIKTSDFKTSVDGYCNETNTVYEFHGDFWHGNPKKFRSNDVNPMSKKTYGELYQKTLERETKIQELGYNLIVMWESDF